jgi:hypothetical protein
VVHQDERPFFGGVLYDLIPLIYHEEYLNNAKGKADYASLFRKLLAADFILAISQATALDFQRLFPQAAAKITTIGGASSSIQVGHSRAGAPVVVRAAAVPKIRGTDGAGGRLQANNDCDNKSNKFQN